MMYLKQSSAVTVMVGPFVDDTDMHTPETGLSIAQADVRLSKNGGGFAQKNSGNSVVHDENGYYSTVLNATDTNTSGTLLLAISVAGALPVQKEFTVLPANVYDSLVGGTDTLQADVTQIDGQATSGNNATLNLKKLNIVNSSGDALVAQSTGSGGNGITASGHGSGEGIKTTGGATGHGIEALGGADAGDGIHAEAQGVGGGSSSGCGIYAKGTLAQAGLACVAGSTGNGIRVYGGSSSGDGLKITGSGYGINAETATGSIIKSTSSGAGLLIEATNSNTPGLHVKGYGTAGGIEAESDGGPGILATGGTLGNGSGIKALGTGTGNGMELTGGSTGHGIETVGGATSGNGFSSSGNGSGAGIVATGTDNNHGMQLVGNGSGKDIDADEIDDILADTNEIQGKLPANNIMGSSDTADHDTDIDAIKTKTDSLAFTSGNVDANVAMIEGSATIDGESITYPYELMMGIANGKYDLNTPSAGKVTFYKRDNTSSLTVVSTGASGRTRDS